MPWSKSRPSSKKRLELQEEQFQHTLYYLQEQAKQALAANREDLAKEALSRKAAAQQQIDQMEPQVQQLTEEEQKLTQTLDALQKRVNDFRTQKETLKAQYTAAKAISTVDESAGRHLEVLQRLRCHPRTGAGQDRHHAGVSGALDELLESGVLEDVGGGTDDIQKELDQVGKDAQVDNELAALKAQLGTGAPEPDALAAAPDESAGEVHAGLVVRRGAFPPRNAPPRRPARRPALLGGSGPGRRAWGAPARPRRGRGRGGPPPSPGCRDPRRRTR